MNNLFNNYDSENDERLDKKFSYNYQVIKNVYPKVSELPEDEVREIIRKYYDATGTHEDSMQAVMNYIREKEPEWKMKYFYNNADNVSENAFNGTSTISASSPMTPNWQGNQNWQDEYDEELIDTFYNHLKQDGIEGYKNFIYCDTSGLNTTGSGLQVPTLKSLSGYTMTMNNAPVSAQNPALTMAQKAAYLQRQNDFCKIYSYIDQNGQKAWDVPLAETQEDEYKELYGEHQPYFQDDELEAAGKEYIRRVVLPVLKEKLEKHNIDFYDTKT